MPKASDCGQCTECKEWTELGDQCCSKSAIFEGASYPFDYFDDIEELPFRYMEREHQIYHDLKREGF